MKGKTNNNYNNNNNNNNSYNNANEFTKNFFQANQNQFSQQKK